MNGSLSPRGLIATLLLSTCSLLVRADPSALHQEFLSLYRQGLYTQAATVAERGLTEAEALKPPNKNLTASFLGNLSQAYKQLGRYAEALTLIERAIALDVRDGEPRVEGLLNNQGGVLAAMGRNEEALDVYGRALAAARSSTNRQAEATVLNNLAGELAELGRYGDAFNTYGEALATLKAAKIPDDSLEVLPTLSNIAGLHLKMAEYDKARALYEQVLQITQDKRGPKHPLVATGLANLGGLYLEIGQNAKALQLFSQALEIEEAEFGRDHFLTIVSLNNVAAAKTALGQFDDALTLYMRAAAITLKSLGVRHPRRAMALNNLAGSFADVGRHEDALRLLTTALDIDEHALGPNHPMTMVLLNNIGLQQAELGQHSAAIESFRRAVMLVDTSRLGGDTTRAAIVKEWSVATGNLGHALAQDPSDASTDQAILYLKLSVNGRQQMRAGTGGFERQVRAAFTKTVEGPYLELARLLVKRERIAEAERVLLLLKERELTDYLLRNGDTEASTPGLALNSAEEELHRDLEAVAANWMKYGEDWQAQRSAKTEGEISAKGVLLEQRRIQLEEQTRSVLTAATARFIGASQKPYEERVRRFNEAQSVLSDKLHSIGKEQSKGSRTAGLILLPGDQDLMLITVTEHTATPITVSVSNKQLSKLANEFRSRIRARADYQALAKELYKLLIAPAEAHFVGALPQHWAILAFGALRSVPFAALVREDGTHLLEHYAVTQLSADGSGGLQNLEKAPKPEWRAAALGASQADPEFGNVPLAGVRREICGVVRGGPSDAFCSKGEGILNGSRYLDADFTLQTLQYLMGPDGGKNNVLHIATHFNLEKSILLMGDGSKLNTRQMIGWNPKLGSYDLVALSACDSGVADEGLESLAGLFQAKGAPAVLATLWPVADVGAAPLLVQFYKERGRNRTKSKAVALQRAQLAMLRGHGAPGGKSADLRHPYFWAPYILLGNWL